MCWDFLVIANPVWETAFLVEQIPQEVDALSRAGGAAGTPAGCAPVTDGGGSALNTACALAMAGRRVLAVGRVGDDIAGRASLGALRRRGVETTCPTVPGRTTKRNTCFVEQGSHATAFAVDAPEHAVPPWEETPAALLEARVLLLDRLAAAAPSWLRARTEALGQRLDESVSPRQGTGHRDKAGRLEADRREDAGRSPAGQLEAPINALVRNSAVMSPTGLERFTAALPHLGYLQVPEDAGWEAPFGATRTGVPPAAGDRRFLSSAQADPAAPAASPTERGRIHRPRSLPLLAAGEITAILGTGVRLLVHSRRARRRRARHGPLDSKTPCRFHRGDRPDRRGRRVRRRLPPRTAGWLRPRGMRSSGSRLGGTRVSPSWSASLAGPRTAPLNPRETRHADAALSAPEPLCPRRP